MSLSREQFEAVVRGYGPTLRRVLLRLTYGRAADADDLLQRTFQKAWEKRDIFRGGEVEPWLRGIARYEHLNHLRRRGQQQRLASAALREAEALAEDSLPELQEDPAPLRDCLERLNDWDRRIVALFYGRRDGAEGGEEMPPMGDREIAGVLDADPEEDWSHDRVRTRRHRALKQLKKCLEAKGALR